MIKDYHNSSSGRVVFSLLLIIGVLSFWFAPAQATNCEGVCDSPLTGEIHVMPEGMDPEEADPPVADFCRCPTYGCDSAVVDFVDWSVGYIDEWQWDFGDPSSGSDNYSNEENPSHVYRTRGDYTVTLTVIGPGGTSTDIMVDAIHVYEDVITDFVVTSTDTCAPAVVQFEDRSINAERWYWYFGDGDSSRVQNPTHTYDTAGVYTVVLRATNACGPRKKTMELVIGEPPVADFKAKPKEGCVPLDGVQFTDLSDGAETWYWEFGDGGTSSDRHPIHTYTVAGVYDVTLTVTNGCGRDSVTKEQYIDVWGEPTADFSADQTDICVGDTVTFTDLSTDADYLEWSFGDGTQSFDRNPKHVYSVAGDYTVLLYVDNRCGDDFEEKVLYIKVSEKPVADFTADQTEICQGDTVRFTDMSTGADTLYWDFGDGTYSSDRNPAHVYANAGTYTVSLWVANACGDDTDTEPYYITVDRGPTADFDAVPDSGNVDLTVVFTDKSTSDLGIDTWDWTFGDGGTSGSQHPTHVYTDPGTYTVTLTVTDGCGKDVDTAYVHVIDSCTVDFGAEPTDGCVDLNVYFWGTEEGSCEISSWSWDFGDGGTGTGQQVEHLYTVPGVYTVTLTAVEADGDIEVTKTDYVTVDGPPVAKIDATPTTGAASLTVNFADSSTSDIPIRSWSWTFGDGTAGSSQQHPSHVYRSAGVYEAMLVVTNDCGPDTARVLITVDPALEVIKSVDRPVALQGEELMYTVKIRNNGDEPIYDISLVDTIPYRSSFVHGSDSVPGTYISGTYSLLSWDVGTLNGQSEVEYSFRVLLSGPFSDIPPDTVRNQAFAITPNLATKSAADGIWPSNIVETLVDKPTGGLDVSKAVDISLASPGDLLTYTIIVENNEPVTAFDVIVWDFVPDSTTYVDGSVSGNGNYYPANDSLDWIVGTLAPAESRTVTFQVTVDSSVADGTRIPNTAKYYCSLGSDESNEVITSVSLTPLVVTKTASRPSGMIGDLIRFTITIDNYSDETFTDVVLLDTMPDGIFLVDGTSLHDGSRLDPTGNNPYSWDLGDLPASGRFTVEYVGVIGASAPPGMLDNIARSRAFQAGSEVHSNRAIAQVFVISYNLTGSIRGIVVVDCDGDGVPDMEVGPTGMDVYLDDGSHSRVNEKGMFYFSTVRAGERVVALDERDLDDYYVPEGAQSSVFAHVHERGESYIIFRVCPNYARLDIRKEASIVPAVKVTKRATMDPTQGIDSVGVVLDYNIDIISTGLSEPTELRIVDSLPEDTRLLLEASQTLTPSKSGDVLTYEVTAASEKLSESVQYSLCDLTPGLRRYLTNKVHIESEPASGGQGLPPTVSDPAEVVAGPFLLAPPKDVQVTLTPALFITSLADLQAPATPQLEAVADSIMKYADAEIKVEGHTDYRPIHTVLFPSNWELGEARALAVVDWLVDNRSIERDRLAYESFAATKPVVEVGTTSEELQPNRRTEVIIKARMAGFMAPGMIPADGWENSTVMPLSPVNFDTVFEASDAVIAIDLEDTWEVFVSIENGSSISAEGVVLTDVLPTGVEYVAGSATIDGVATAAEVVSGALVMTLDRVDPSQTLELRYRIRSLAGSTPSGGGAATVEVKALNDQSVKQSSNEVRFE